MRSSQDRLTRFGVVVVAGIAVLGWLREPEKHQFPDKAARATFQPPQDSAGPPVVRELPGDPAPFGAEPGEIRTRRRALSVHNAPRPGEPPVSKDRSEPETHDRTRTPEPELRSLPPYVPEAETRTDDRTSQTPPVVHPKKRSTVRSVAIIAGAAAAGAAIGGLSSGGKGAAIGAITGGAGGYVYDRVTRRRSSPPDMTHRDPSLRPSEDRENIDDESYRRPALARQFGTPGFAGR